MAEYDGSIVVKLALKSAEYEKGLDGAVKQTESFTDKVKSTFVGATVFKIAQKGWDLISSSVEKATNRLDAMAKAKQVMSILAGSTEEAEKVVNNLNEAVTDTAYGLDSAASSTQKLATSGLGLDKSTKMVEDMMDAISFYGDGTNATLENTIDAISKMNSSSKVSADQWQRLTDAGIPVLKMFSEKTGKSMAEVSDAFSKGEISAQEFNDILMDALENGTESFPAVAGKAKEMAGSFATSFSNMSARIAIGVGNVITAFNDYLKDSGLPSLQESIANFGSVLKNGLNWVADNIPGVLDMVKNTIKAVADAMPNLQNAIEGVVKFFQNNGSGILDTVKSFGEWAVNQLPAIARAIDGLAPVILGVATALGVINGYFGMLNMVFKASQMIQKVTPVVAQFMTIIGSVNPIVLVVAAITALVAAFVYLWNTSEDFRNFWINLWEKVKKVVSDVVDWIGGAWGNAVQGIQNAWNGITSFFSDVANGITDAWNGVVEFFTVTIPQALQSFADTVVNFFTVTIPEAIQSFEDAIAEFFGTTVPYYIGYAVGFVVGKLVELGQSFVDFVTVTIPEFVNGVIDWFKQLPGNIWTWLLQTLDNINTWAGNLIQQGTDAATNFFNSVIDWFKQLPGNIWSWLLNVVSNVNSWAVDMYSKATDAGSKFLNGVLTWIKQLPGQIWNWFINTLSKVNAWAGNMRDAAVDAGLKFFNGIVDKVKEIPGKMLSLGGDIVNGIKSGIQNAWNGLTSWFSNLAGGLVDGFKSALGIHSPSRVFRAQAKWIPEGMVEGMKDTMPKAIAFMKDAGDSLSAAFNADSLSSRLALEGAVSDSRGYVTSGNSYTVNQTINSHDSLSPSEMAQETRNAIRRAAWQ